MLRPSEMVAPIDIHKEEGGVPPVKYVPYWVQQFIETRRDIAWKLNENPEMETGGFVHGNPVDFRKRHRSKPEHDEDEH